MSLVKEIVMQTFYDINIKHKLLIVASSGIEPESGASEALILSIVLRGQYSLLSKMRKITAEYFYRNGQQYYAKKFSDYCHTVWT